MTALRLIVALIAALLVNVADARDTWTFTSHAVAGSVDDRSWQSLIRHIEERAGDRIDVRALLRGEGGTETTYLSYLRRGRVQVSTASFASSAAIVPEVALLSLPYLFESREEIDFVVDHYLDDAYRSLFAAKGLTLLRWLDVGWINVAALTPLRTPADLIGKRLRAPASPAARLFLERAGADVAVLPFAEIVPGLDTGLIDGAVTTAIMYDGLLKDSAPHFALTQHSYEVGFLLANRRWYERLSLYDQALILDGYPDTRAFRDAVRSALSDTMNQLTDAGHAHALTDAELDAWRAATIQDNKAFIDELGGDAQRLHALIIEGKAAFAAQSRGMISTGNSAGVGSATGRK